MTLYSAEQTTHSNKPHTGYSLIVYLLTPRYGYIKKKFSPHMHTHTYSGRKKAFLAVAGRVYAVW